MRITASAGGGRGLEEAVRVARNKLRMRLPEAMKAAAGVLLDKSQELVPTDTEALKESGRVKEIGEGFDKVYYVGYGGEFGNNDGVLKTTTGKHGKAGLPVVKVPSQYAVMQHENHALHHTNGQANYLGQPGKDASVEAEMARAIEAALR